MFILVFLGWVFVSSLFSAGVHRRCLFSCSWAGCLYLTWSLPVFTGGVYSRVPGLGVCTSVHGGRRVHYARVPATQVRRSAYQSVPLRTRHSSLHLH